MTLTPDELDQFFQSHLEEYQSRYDSFVVHGQQEAIRYKTAYLAQEDYQRNIINIVNRRIEARQRHSPKHLQETTRLIGSYAAQLLELITETYIYLAIAHGIYDAHPQPNLRDTLFDEYVLALNTQLRPHVI